MHNLIDELKKWIKLTDKGNGYNIYRTANKFSLTIKKGAKMSNEKAPQWFSDFESRQMEFNKSQMEFNKRIESKVDTNANMIKQAHPDLFK